MTRAITFYFDFLSPYTYLALTQLPALAEQAGATVDYKPISVLAVMQLVGNSPTTILSKAKGAYAMADIGRWAGRYGVPVGPDRAQRQIDDAALLAGAAAAGEVGQIAGYTQAVFGAVWGEGPAITDDGVLRDVLRKGGVTNVEAILAGRERGARIVEANVKAAAEAGIFGVPSFVLGGQLYFGNDRLSFLQEALAA